MSADKPQYVQYVFWRVDSVFQNLEMNERLVAKQHFLGTWDSQQRSVFSVTYAVTGLRVDSDILCVRAADSLEALQDMSSRLQTSGMGKFMTPTYSFLALASGPRYVAKASGAGEFQPGQGRYLFVSPWVRGTEWYALSPSERQKGDDALLTLAKDHKARLHPGLKGLDEVDDLIAAEVDEPKDFLEFFTALKDLRRETHSLAGPTFVCALKDIRDHVDSLG